MKPPKIIFFTVLILCTVGVNIRLSAQQEKIVFQYDLSGNRVSKNLTVLKVGNFEQLPDCLKDSLGKQEYDVRIYPNPTNDYLNIEFSKENQIEKSHIIIVGINGDIKYTSEVSDKHTTLDFSRYANGEYFIKIFNNLKSISYKVIKN